MNVLVWLKRDLRLTDHPALTHAAAIGRVLPVFVIEPSLWALPDASARQWSFVAECLTDLRASLARLGAPLIVRTGEAVDVLDRLCRQHRIGHLVSHQETGTLASFARDRAVADWARAAGIPWTELAQSGVTRRLTSRDDWAGRRDAFMAAPLLPIPALRPVAGAEPGPIPSARALKLAPDPCPHRQHGGRSQGLGLLDSFLARRGEPYRTALSSPVSAERNCSRLSPHLAWGTLSLREVVQATDTRQAQRPGGRWGGALSSYQSRLAWRDHFIQKLEDQPSIEARDLHPLAILQPRDSDAARLAGWAKGETGLPFLDACQRYLAATGWLNFRMRAMVTSFASYQLWLDWQASGQHLARMFTDYEPGIHWPQMQMQSGTTGINLPRIYNPVKQGLEQDPSGAFTRAWVPELACVPDMFLQMPWKWPEARRVLGRRYPEPMVDLASATRAARAAIWHPRTMPEFGTEAERIVQRHASRADRRFVNDRTPRRPAAAQLALDL